MNNESVYKDNIDRKAWAALFEKCRALQEKAQGEVRKDLLADTHTSLLKPSPMVKPVVDVASSRIPVHTVIDEMLRTSDWRNLHAVTQNDPVGAGMGTLSLADHLLSALREFGDTEELAQMEKQMQHLKDLGGRISTRLWKNHSPSSNTRYPTPTSFSSLTGLPKYPSISRNKYATPGKPGCISTWC